MSHPLLIESDSPLHSNIHANNKNTYANPFEMSSNFGSDPTHVTIEPDDVDLSSPLARPINVTGSIGSQPIRRFANDTLDEPVSETILRDVKNVAVKLQQVLKPKGGRKDILKDWDLWGPLFLCLTLSIVLCLKAPKDQEIAVFTGVFVIVWCGAAAVTINAKLLGGNV
ncbi:10714_t:CDS:2 [Entrophospora sp. SA101]|nr:7475_t:CDS:2 [Entrophospora candida]CAH1758748.1 270_t:CDS:2 [Entrophospora sp. SA101]CAJ0829199.1 10714_t:CDS:2 [Entrophospora sp. SA101]CAJ0892847.1 7633_t:CDS:2 [Entrophospora sp. SA101]